MTEITLKELADKYNFNVDDVSFMELDSSLSSLPNTKVKKEDVKINTDKPQYIKISLNNGDWIDIYHPYYARYMTNNNSVHKALTTKLHDMREEGIRLRDRELKSMKTKKII